MLGDCHIHMVLDGVLGYREAMDRHRAGPDDAVIRRTLRQYQRAGMTFLRDGGVAYVNHDPLRSGDAGIFCVDGEMFCKQYYRDPLGMVYLFSLNRKRADADILLPPESGRSLVCLGRVMLHTMPLPGKDEA